MWADKCGLCYTGVNVGDYREPCIYLVVAHYCYLVWLAPRVMKGIGGFPTAFTDFANISFLGIPMPLFFSCVCLFSWLLVHRTHMGRNVFLIGQAPVSRSTARSR